MLLLSGHLLYNHCYYRVFIKYCVFSLKCCDLSELCQFCCTAGFLPAWCVYTQWHRGKTEKGQSPEYFKNSEKKTPYVMNTLLCCLFDVHCYVIAFTSFLNNPGIRICLYIYTKYHVNNNGQHQSETRDFIVIRSGRPANANNTAV